jgi:hypothetical protein
MDGDDVERLVELSLDGELGPSEEADLAAQITGSPEARDLARRTKRFHLGLRDKLREASKDTMTPPDLEHRVVYRLRCESEGAREARRPWGRAVVATLAVAVVVVAGWSTSAEVMDPEDLVERHSSNRPPELRPRGSLDETNQFLRSHLGFLVHVPEIREPHVRLVGVRLAQLRNHEAAHVMFDHRGARISMLAFPRPSRLRPPAGFTTRVVSGREVVVGQHRGYNLVAFAEGDVAYALVSVLDREQLLSLVSGFRPSN